MKLVTFKSDSLTVPRSRIGAVQDGGRVVDLQASYYRKVLAKGTTPCAAERISQALIPNDMVAFIQGGALSLEAAEEGVCWAYESGDEAIVMPSDSVELLSPIPTPPLLRDFMAFEQHLKNIYPKLNREIPPEWYELPVYYKANNTSIGAHGQDIAMPSYASEIDFEFELGIVIGRDGTNIDASDARNYIYGMMIYNDFSAREIQSREMSVGLGPAKGKDFQNAHVFGPWLVTIDEIPDPYNLRMMASVNGNPWCDSNSGTIHWKFEDMIAHASKDELIRAGEVFGSGTVGDGSGAERGIFLKPGDRVELQVEGLGTLTNRVV